MLRSQRGITLIGVLLVAGLISFASVVGMKLLPLYLDAAKINSAIEKLPRDVVQEGEEAIYSRIGKQLVVEGVNGFKPEESVTVEKEAGKIVITAEYELRRPLFAGLDVVLVQKRRVEFPQ